MEHIITFIIAVFCTESVTEILSKSALFEPFRKWLFMHRKKSLFNFLHSLFDCGYCLSVWVGFLFSFIIFGFDLNLISPIIDVVILGLVVHRLSNVLHNMIDRTRKEF